MRGKVPLWVTMRDWWNQCPKPTYTVCIVSSSLSLSSNHTTIELILQYEVRGRWHGVQYMFYASHHQ